MPRGPVLTVVITSVNEGLDKGLGEAEKKIGGFGKAAGKLAGVAKVAAPIVGIAAAAAKLGSAADKAATDTASFDKAMKAAGVSAGKLDPAIAGAVKGAQAMAFSGGEAKDALVSLQTATGDAAKSAELLAIAQDVARLSGADLTVAADAVAKAYAGTDRQLRALLPGLPATASGFDTIAAAEAAAAGQAEIFADSAEGGAIKTKAALKGLAITVGTAVQPAFRALMDALGPLITAFGELVTALLPVLVPLVQAVANVFTKLATIVTNLIRNLLPPLEKLVKAITTAFDKARSIIQGVVDVVKRLADAIDRLLAPLDKALKKLHELSPFKGQIGGLMSGQTQQVATMMAVPTKGVGGQGMAGVTINIYGDPSVIEARVTKALRDYARRNGTGAVFTPERT